MNIPEPILQKDLEEYQLAIRRLDDWSLEELSEAKYKRLSVEAAMECDWCEEVDLGEMLPYEVSQMAEEIADAVTEATTVPKN